MAAHFPPATKLSAAFAKLVVVNGNRDRLRVVGTGATGSMSRAASYFERLARQAADGVDVFAYLDSSIESARAALEDCLRGFDSFDTLAFLRLATSPWDFTDVQESQTQFENSQAAQDVVALTLLGMGLPRQPLTGKNSGQPDIGKAMSLAGQIVRAAQSRAMLQGHDIDQPLGTLAGEFLGYELAVRGRQYNSVAAELNTGLLGALVTSGYVESSLGFTLEDVRAVRTAGAALLNERFFGARDRVGDAAQSGAGLDGIDVEAFGRDINLMMNECRLFGAVSAPDVAARAGIAEGTAAAVLDCFSFAKPGDGEANPLERFARGSRPVPWGCIADGGEYLILNGFLGEDELRRDIERQLVANIDKGGSAAKLWPKYDKRRANYAESKAAETLGVLLAGAEPRWMGQRYVGPLSIANTAALGRDADRSSVEAKGYESDLLFVVDGVAFCVEVKAGSVTDKARGGHAKRLAADLEKTLKEGNEQADRLATLIRINHGVWSTEGEWIDLAGVGEVHSIIVMLDDMGPLSLSMNELAARGIIDTDEVPWIVSLHDLIVMSRTFDHPAQFLEYLRRRRGRKLATMVRGADELDMLMWFLDGGMYFDPDPNDVAAQLPVEKPIKASDLRRFEEQGRVQLGTLTDPLDAWFYGAEGLSRTDAPKPVRHEEPWVEQYLTASESAKSPGWLRFGADLVGLSDRAQRDIGRGLKKQCRNARGGVIERSLTTHSASPQGAWLLTASVVPKGAGTDHLPKYIDAKQYQTHSSRSMLLLYNTDGALEGSRFCGDPQPRTAERDAEVEVVPLRSLKATFSTVPPSARRSTKRLRGKRGSKNRRG